MFLPLISRLHKTNKHIYIRTTYVVYFPWGYTTYFKLIACTEYLLFSVTLRVRRSGASASYAVVPSLECDRGLVRPITWKLVQADSLANHSAMKVIKNSLSTLLKKVMKLGGI